MCEKLAVGTEHRASKTESHPKDVRRNSKAQLFGPLSAAAWLTRLQKPRCRGRTIALLYFEDTSFIFGGQIQQSLFSEGVGVLRETSAAFDLFSQKFDVHSPPTPAINIDAHERLLKALLTFYFMSSSLSRTTNLSRSHSSTSC